jgi:hypothetical protein
MRAAICASTLFALVAVLATVTASADEYDDTIAIFKGAGQSGSFFAKSAVFTVAKGGLMYEATVAGQKFKYKPL